MSNMITRTQEGQVWTPLSAEQSESGGDTRLHRKDRINERLAQGICVDEREAQRRDGSGREKARKQH